MTEILKFFNFFFLNRAIFLRMGCKILAHILEIFQKILQKSYKKYKSKHFQAPNWFKNTGKKIVLENLSKFNSLKFWSCPTSFSYLKKSKFFLKNYNFSHICAEIRKSPKIGKLKIFQVSKRLNTQNIHVANKLYSKIMS